MKKLSTKGLFNKKPKKFSKTKTEILSPKSPFAFTEAYKSLRTNLSFMTFDGAVKVIVVASSIPSEGKSSVSLNLATTLAQTGKEVLLMDSDLRSPSIHRYLNVRRNLTDGFSSVIAGKSGIVESIVRHETLGINIMMSGPIPPNASELLTRDKTKEVIEQLRKNFDYVIIDTPPADVVSDAAILASYSDGVLMVVRQNLAERETVQRALRKLQASGAPILGTIMNAYERSKNIKEAGDADYSYQYGEQ